ncbi:MAG: methyltransferase domain-containing protein [Anaerolineae bacterium]|nr:methyltransferase domain-containing protein [Anaerolineae bacterium]
MTNQSRIALFDRWAERYERSVQSASGVFEGYDLVLSQVALSARVHRGMQVLDLGIGTGNLARRFVALGCEVWGIDFSPAMLARARANVPQVKLVEVDLLDVWPDELDRQFDRIVSTYVLHEFDLPAKVSLLVRLADHYLADQGRIVIGDIAFPTAQALKEAGADHWDKDEHYWTADGTRAACDRVGLHASYTQVSSCGGVFVIEPEIQIRGRQEPPGD